MLRAKSSIIFFCVLLVLLYSPTTLSSQATVELNFEQAFAPNNLIGFNTGFDHRHWVVKEVANGKTTYTTEIRDEIVEPLSALAKPVLRFPGGVLANFYHLYPENYDCVLSSPCEDDFSKAYGLRLKEVQTFNNGFGSVGSEYSFEQNANNILSSNWIVTFADFVEETNAQTPWGDVEIVYMANVVSHFKFGNQAVQFEGNEPLESSPEFQRSLNETRDALIYLKDVRGLNVKKLEMGTELYFPVWENNNDVNIDRFINLIPIYRDMLDELGYNDLKIGVPINHNHNLNPNSDNWSRKLADLSYHDNMMFDAWILHDYQRMVEPCNVLFGNCNGCNDWDDMECQLYTNNINILNCEPDNHKPDSDILETVFQKKNERFSEAFNGGLAEEYKENLVQLRALSGKDDSRFWMTEWNEVFDGGCDQWKGINKFFPNTFAHGVNIFEMLNSFYQENATSNNEFIEISNFHTLGAPNGLYPVIKASNDVSLNVTYYPFYFISQVSGSEMVSVDTVNTGGSSKMNLYAFTEPQGGSVYQTQLFFSNKTNDEIELEIIANDMVLNDANSSITSSYITADALHSSINGEYIFNPENVTAGPVNIENLDSGVELSSPYKLPAMAFGYLNILHGLDDATEEENVVSPVQLFPNPTSDQLVLVSDHSKNYQIKLIDQLGNLISSNKLENELILSLTGYASGVYYVHIIGEEVSWIERLVKL